MYIEGLRYKNKAIYRLWMRVAPKSIRMDVLFTDIDAWVSITDFKDFKYKGKRVSLKKFSQYT